MAVGTGIALFGANPTDVNINVEGTMKEGIRARDIGASKIEDFTGALTQVANTTANLINAEKASEANDAKADWVNIYNSEGYKNADDVGKAEMIEEQLGTLGDRSDSYSKAFRANIYSEYDRVYKGRQTIENNAIYNSAPNTFKLYEMETGGTAEQFVNDMSTEYPQLDKNVLKTSLLEGVYQDIYTEVESATNEGELTTALANIEDIKASYQGDKFLQTKSKQGKELIRAAESKVQAMVKAKQAEFVTMHKTAISTAVDEGYSEHPIKLEDDFKGAYSDPLTRQSKQAQYTKKYEESTEALAYNSENPLGSNPQNYPNDMAKDNRELAVTDTMLQLFNGGEPSEFVRIGMGEKGLTKKAGDMLLAKIDTSKNPEELGQALMTISQISEVPQGATVLRQMFTDDEYARVMKTVWVSRFRPEYTPEKARDYIHGLSKNIARTQLAPDKKAKMFDYASKLGRQGDKFLALMNTFTATDAGMAEDMMKDVYSFFEKQTGKTTTGVKTDNSMGVVPESLDPERTDKYIDEALGDVHSITYVDDMIVGYDEIGGVVKIVNSSPIIERSNSNYEDAMIREQEVKQNATIVSDPGLVVKETAKTVGRSVVDNIGDFVVGVPDVLGDVVGNISEAIWGNAMRNLRETNPNIYAFFNADTLAAEKAPKPDYFDEILLEVLSEKSDKLDTRMPETVQNNTFSAQMQGLVTNGLLRNEAEKAKIDTKIEETTEVVRESQATKEVPFNITKAIEEGKLDDTLQGKLLFEPLKEANFNLEAKGKEFMNALKAQDKPKANNIMLDLNNFKGNIPKPKKGEDPLTYMHNNVFGLNEDNPEHRKALKGFIDIDPKKVAWCGALAGNILESVGAELPKRAKANKALAYNYQHLGDSVYDHNPTTGKTYGGKLSDVRVGDIVVFNSTKGRNNSKGDFNYGNGHVGFIVDTKPDGTLVVVGGNQGGGKRVQTSTYSPSVIKKYYKGGFKVRRVNNTSLEQTSPLVISNLTNKITKGKREQ